MRYGKPALRLQHSSKHTPMLHAVVALSPCLVQELRPPAGSPKAALYRLLALLWVSLRAAADPLPPAARAEVVAVLARLELDIEKIYRI